MANPADEWSGADLAAIPRDGLINEEVMQAIWDISNIPLPFSDRCGTMSTGNSYHTWTQDRLPDPDVTNAVVDGADQNQNDAQGGKRVGNHCQISTKRVSVTTRARNSNTIARSDELAYQVSRRQIDLRRDREAILMLNQASQADDNDTVPGLLGGLASWYETNVDFGAGGSAGGYNTGTGLTEAYTPGTARALSETTLRDLIQAAYEQGQDDRAYVAMSTPNCIRRISEYMFTDTARIATLESDQNKSREKAAALGAVNYFISDFGALELTANRLQQEVAADVAELHLLDFSMLRCSFLHGYKVDPLAKTGLADKRMMSVDGSLAVLNEEGIALYADIDTSAPMAG